MWACSRLEKQAFCRSHTGVHLGKCGAMNGRAVFDAFAVSEGEKMDFSTCSTFKFPLPVPHTCLDLGFLPSLPVAWEPSLF